jgi:hypothetical protein
MHVQLRAVSKILYLLFSSWLDFTGETTDPLDEGSDKRRSLAPQPDAAVWHAAVAGIRRASRVGKL